MFICIRKQQLCLGAALLLCLAPAAAFFSCGIAHPVRQTFGAEQGRPPVTVIVDAGHGGEDGGAVAADGTKESGINLAIALRVHDLLRFTGQSSTLTRQEDISLHGSGAETIRQKKVSDLKNRVELVNAAENALLLSIHQNSLPSSPETHGAQVFYNKQEGADAAAKLLQDALNETINTHRAKECKAIGSDVYLMAHINRPGLLVECGFLSHGEEAARLKTTEHQKTLTCAIVSGLLRSVAGEEAS